MIHVTLTIDCPEADLEGCCRRCGSGKAGARTARWPSRSRRRRSRWRTSRRSWTACTPHCPGAASCPGRRWSPRHDRSRASPHLPSTFRASPMAPPLTSAPMGAQEEHMTFYELAEAMFMNGGKRPGYPLHRQWNEINQENLEQLKQGRALYSFTGACPLPFHPRETQTVIVEYSGESQKASKEVSLDWTKNHGEVDEVKHIYPDDIERVYFINKDTHIFWV
jgi:hypothetical protein